MQYALIALGLILVAGIFYAFWITRDARLVTPQGVGTLELEVGTFEAFPLPDYAQAFVTDEYQSYFIEVEPGIKVHMLEVGEGYPLLMLHGNPSSPFLYRKVVAELPTDRMRIIMPTLVGLGFSSKVPVSEHTVANHNRWINEALRQLKLERLMFVGQDWGGIIGTGAMSLSPEMLEGIVMMNSGIFAPEEKISISRIHKIAKTPILGDFLIENYTTAFAG
ncbi:MAG: alpha/beta fold hydrolase, partial [Pseudomonadota bacterium]